MTARKTTESPRDSRPGTSRRFPDRGAHKGLAEAIEDLSQGASELSPADTALLREVSTLLASAGVQFRKSLRCLVDAWHKWSGKGVPPMPKPTVGTTDSKEQLKQLWAQASSTDRQELLLGLEPHERDAVAGLIREVTIADFEDLIFGDSPRTLHQFNRFLMRCTGKKIPTQQREFYAHAISWALRERFADASLLFSEDAKSPIACTITTELTNRGANRIFRIRERGHDGGYLWRKSSLPTLVAE